jgi:hypothetical protein
LTVNPADSDRTEHRQADVGLCNAGIGVAVVAAADLDERRAPAAVARLAIGQRREIAVDAGLDFGWRLASGHRFEFFARADVVAGVEISACQLEAGARVVGKLQHVTLECQDAFAGTADVDCGDTAPQIEFRRALGRVDRGCAMAGVRRGGVAGFDGRAQVIDWRREGGKRESALAQRDRNDRCMPQRARTLRERVAVRTLCHARAAPPEFGWRRS